MKPRRWITGILAILILAWTFAGCANSPVGTQHQAVTAAPGGETVTPLSTQALEQEYGVRVNLLAVTAAGGLVDLRLSIVDVAKAKTLLDDLDRFPTLLVGDSRVTLTAPEESRHIDSSLKQGGLIVIMYPNAQGAVTPGTAVTVAFGDLHLAPISAM